ncbi:hypothetical protein ACFLYV_04630 [Chloroflexota bacterium]
MQPDSDKAKFIQRWCEDPGWRAFVGFISVPNLALSTLEFMKIAPEGFATAEQHTYATKNGVPTVFDYSVEGIQEAATQVEQCAMILKAIGVDLIAQSGTPFTFLREGGLENSKRVQEKIENSTGLPAVFMGLALPSVLNKLGHKSVAMSCTYYSEAWRQGFTRSIEESGIKVLGNENFVTLGMYPNHEAVKMQPTRRFPLSVVYRSAKTVANQHPEADCIVIAGGGVCTMDIIEALENDLGKPVISTSAALYYEIFQRLGVFEQIIGRGSLLASLKKFI